MRQILAPDLSATVEIDPELEVARTELERQEAALEVLRTVEGEPDAAKIAELAEAVKGAREDLAEYEASEDRPAITIGYIPPAKLSHLKSLSARKRIPNVPDGVLVVDLTDEQRAALMDFSEADAEFNRETCRWGVRGWRLKWKGTVTEFVSESIEHRGRQYQVAVHEAVDVIEAAGWLGAVALAIWRFNTLDEGTRKK